MDKTENKIIRKDTPMKVIYGFFLFLVVLTFVFMLLKMHNTPVDFSFNDSSIYDWNGNWSLNVDNQSHQQVSLPLKLDSEYGAIITLKKKLPNTMEEYNCLIIESKRQDIYAYVGNDLRKSYTSAQLVGGHSLPFAYVLVPIYNTDANKTVTLSISSDTYYSGNISKVYLGNEMSIILMLIKSNMVWLCLILILLIIGVVCLLSFFIYRKSYDQSRLFLFLFWFALFSSIWCFDQLKILQIFVEDLALMESIGYCAFLLIPIPLALSADAASNRSHKLICEIILILAMINFLVQNTLHSAFHYDYFEMQNITQIFTLLVIITGIILCSIDIHRKILRGLPFLLIGLLGPFFGIVSEAVCVAANLTYTKGSLFLLGATVFLAFNMILAFVNISKEQQKRKDAESANLAKSLFLATMSHEIRTPINAVLGMNEMVLRECEDEKIREYSVNIEEAGKSLLSLVNDILDFSKIESGKMDIVCVEYQLKSVLRDLIMMARSRIANKPLKLELAIDESIPSKYFGDEVRIKQVITNLLTNAVKYTESGSVTFTVTNEGIAEDSIKLHFSVRDTGIGIKPEDIAKLKDSAFVRVDEERNRHIEGTGLGLSITRQLLSLMNSELEVDSVYGEGSDFHFTLVQKIVDSSPMGPVENRDSSKDKKRKNTFTSPDAKILAVDDNKTNLMVIKGLLKIYGIEAEICDSGQACINLCTEKSYDIIFMDHMMPGMDGIQTLENLRSLGVLGGETKVVALTANAISGAEQMYRDHGFDCFVTKPIDINELDTCLKTMLPAEKVIELEGEASCAK